jgi:C4-dicarboxylate-binding protein DctP
MFHEALIDERLVAPHGFIPMRIMCILSALIIFSVMCADANAAPKNIRLTLQLTPESLLYQNLKAFRDQVAEESHGELDIQIFPSSQLYKPNEVPGAVGSGLIEMGSSQLSQYDKIVPATDIFAIPFLFSLPGLFEAAIMPGSGVRIALDDAIRTSTGARVLWWAPIGSEAFGSKGSPLLTPSDIAGKKVRVPGVILSRFINECGGTGVITLGSEQYGVLKRGDVDAVSTGMEIFESRKLWELTDQLTLLHHTHQIHVILINEMFWRSLSGDERRIIQNAASEAQIRSEKQDAEADRRGIETLKERGMHVTEAGPDDLEQWKICSSPVSEAFLENSGAAGGKVMLEYRRLLLNLIQSQSTGGRRY